MAAVAAITTRKIASSLKKMRFFTGLVSEPSSHGCSSSPSFWRFKAVGGAAHSLEVAGIFRVGLDFLADAANVDIHRTWRDVGGVAPDGIEQLVAGEDAAFVAGQIKDTTEGTGGGGCRRRRVA